MGSNFTTWGIVKSLGMATAAFVMSICGFIKFCFKVAALPELYNKIDSNQMTCGDFIKYIF